MRLLVSVANEAEASAALAGGADLIEAICAGVAGARPVTAALGNASDADAIFAAARQFAEAGARWVKVGFAGIASPERVGVLTKAAVDGARTGAAGAAGRPGCGVVAVAFADVDRALGLAPFALVAEAARAGANGLLLDTADKSGPGLRALMDSASLTAFVSSVREAGLLVALAGQLGAADLPFVRDAGADIAGVRGAACEGGRTGHVSADRVRLLRQSCR